MIEFWFEPDDVKDKVAKAIPKKSEWEIEATKTPNCDWAFDLPPFIKYEALTGGTESIIDTYYIHIKGKPADVGDTIKMTIAVDKPKKYDACCTDFVLANDAFGHDYVETNTQMTGWFCPMLEIMFGEVPKQIYIKFS